MAEVWGPATRCPGRQRTSCPEPRWQAPDPSAVEVSLLHQDPAQARAGPLGSAPLRLRRRGRALGPQRATTLSRDLDGQGHGQNDASGGALRLRDGGAPFASAGPVSGVRGGSHPVCHRPRQSRADAPPGVQVVRTVARSTWTPGATPAPRCVGRRQTGWELGKWRVEAPDWTTGPCGLMVDQQNDRCEDLPPHGYSSIRWLLQTRCWTAPPQYFQRCSRPGAYASLCDRTSPFARSTWLRPEANDDWCTCLWVSRPGPVWRPWLILRRRSAIGGAAVPPGRRDRTATGPWESGPSPCLRSGGRRQPKGVRAGRRRSRCAS